jgi:ribonucleotide monophosphatase NagD (HAD superfamily)
MIGDNLDTDIKGAYNYGWKSVLVRTGVSQHST